MLHYKPLEIFSTTYPFCFHENYFSVMECKKIISYCNLLPKQTAEVIDEKNQKSLSTKRFSDISWIEHNDKSKWFYDKFASGIDSLNQSFYQLDLTGFNKIQFTEYDSSKFAKYDWHMDMILGNNKENLTRKLSATLLLNDTFNG